MPDILFPIAFLYCMVAVMVISFIFFYKKKVLISFTLIWLVILVTMVVGIKMLSPAVGLIFIAPIGVFAFISWLYYSDYKRK